MILVTGSNGFIGSEIVKVLDFNKFSFKCFNGDITNLDDIKKYQDDYKTIIHIASVITHKNHKSEEELYNVNVNGTLNLLKQFPNSHFVYISTTDVERINLSDYAKTKLQAEQMVLNNKSDLVIRLPSIFGAKSKQKKLIPLLIEKYLDNTEFRVSNNEIREYMYVKKCAKSIVNSISKSGIIRLNGIKISNKELEEMVKDIIGCHEKKKKYYHYIELYCDLIDMIKEIRVINR